MYPLMPSSWSIRELLVWNRWESLAERVLTGHIAPYNWRWQEDVDFLDELIPRGRREFPSEVWRFLQEVMLAAVLSRTVLCNESERETIIAGINHDQILPHGAIYSGKWAVVPWVMVNPDIRGRVKGRICCFLIGSLDIEAADPLPSWWSRVADEKACKSVINAMKLAVDRLGCLLLIRPLLVNHSSLQICGSSLGLAVYAGALCACRGITGRLPLLFSGGVTSSGRFSEPGFVREKALIARKFGFRALVCGSSTPARRVQVRDGVETIPVLNPEDLEWILLSYAPGLGERALSTALIMSSPELMASKIGQIELKVVRSLLFREKYIERVSQILNSPDDAELFAENLANFCYSRNYNRDLWEYLIKPLWPLVGESSHRMSPVVLWHIASCGWACAYSEGEMEEAKKWRILAGRALAKIAKTPRQLEFVADYHNRLFVHSRHLNFHFGERLPKGFRSILKKLETFYNCAAFDAYPVLGRMYGTVAQNYGFSGPEYLPNLEEYVKRAQRAFGDGKISEFHRDWRREFNYLIYGYLDAGLFEKAEKYFLPYLGVTTLKDLKLPASASYETAALLRFAADTDTPSIISGDMVNSLLSNPVLSHPFQLALFNLGRVLKERDRKREAWIKSLRICLKLRGPRLVLGLLPLAALYKEELAEEDEISRCFWQICGEIGRLKGFNRNHFADVLPLEMYEDFLIVESCLKKVWERRCNLFPFTCR